MDDERQRKHENRGEKLGRKNWNCRKTILALVDVRARGEYQVRIKKKKEREERE